MTSKPFKIDFREFGRGPANIRSFSTLIEARDYIRDHWQGPEYIDGPGGFHSDYCTFRLIGFALADVGKRVWYEDWFDWQWHTLDGDAPEIDDQPDDRRPETTAWDDDEPAECGPVCRPPEPRRPAPDDIPF
jgi:hypothetical protein